MAVVLATLAAGCLDFNGRGATILRIDLLWDEDTASSGFSPGTCRSAGVANVTWSLTDSDTGKEIDSSNGSVSCINGLDWQDPHPGDYTLKVTGSDKDGAMLWKATCKGLAGGLRFDAAYWCEVDASP
jgi:hypothetical protein